MQYLFLLLALGIFALAHSAHAATSKRQLPASILNLPATKAIQLPGIDRFVFVDEPIYPGSHFTWGEATKNGSRIPVDTTFDGENYPATKIVQNIIDFARELDDIRERFGNRPISVNSWFRTSAANRAAGGKPNSLHLIGLAADGRILGVNPRTVYKELSVDWLGGLGNDGAYTHIDARHKLGWDVARWTY